MSKDIKRTEDLTGSMAELCILLITQKYVKSAEFEEKSLFSSCGEQNLHEKLFFFSICIMDQLQIKLSTFEFLDLLKRKWKKKNMSDEKYEGG